VNESEDHLVAAARCLIIHPYAKQPMKVLSCRDAGFDCPQVMRAESENEVLQQAAAHALAVHQVAVTPQMAEAIKGLIREEV
jgi:predicted small metal-binding protein